MTALKVRSEFSEMNKIRGFLRKSLAPLNINEEDSFWIELAVVEICINIIRYAYPDEKGTIYLDAWEKAGKIYFEVRDSGIPFDPSKKEDPHIGQIIRRKAKGGLGIFLSRKLMDGFEYRREDEQNILTMFKKINHSQKLDI